MIIIFENQSIDMDTSKSRMLEIIAQLLFRLGESERVNMKLMEKEEHIKQYILNI